MRSRQIASLAFVLCSIVSARYLDPCLDPANEYEVSLKEADSLYRYFNSVLQVYNDHTTEYHDLVGCRVTSPQYPNMPQEFYERNAENIHWIELNWDLDGLHSNMFSLQVHYNQHIIDNHPGLDTLVDAVYDLGFPDVEMTEVEMTEREYIIRKVFQLRMMITKLKSAIEAHVEYHIDPTIPDHEPAVLPEPEPRAEPRYDPPETAPEEIAESATESSESDASDSARVEALREKFAEVFNAFLKLRARYNDHLGAEASVKPYLASCSHKSLKPDWPPAHWSAGEKLEALLEKKDALWDCLLAFQEVYNEHLSVCSWGGEINVVPDPHDFPDFRTGDMVVMVGSWIDVLDLWTNSLREAYDEHSRFHMEGK